jgi:hypothetical protein
MNLNNEAYEDILQALLLSPKNEEAIELHRLCSQRLGFNENAPISIHPHPQPSNEYQFNGAPYFTTNDLELYHIIERSHNSTALRTNSSGRTPNLSNYCYASRRSKFPSGPRDPYRFDSDRLEYDSSSSEKSCYNENAEFFRNAKRPRSSNNSLHPTSPNKSRRRRGRSSSSDSYDRKERPPRRQNTFNRPHIGQNTHNDGIHDESSRSLSLMPQNVIEIYNLTSPSSSSISCDSHSISETRSVTCSDSESSDSTSVHPMTLSTKSEWVPPDSDSQLAESKPTSNLTNDTPTNSARVLMMPPCEPRISKLSGALQDTFEGQILPLARNMNLRHYVKPSRPGTVASKANVAVPTASTLNESNFENASQNSTTGPRFSKKSNPLLSFLRGGGGRHRP